MSVVDNSNEENEKDVDNLADALAGVVVGDEKPENDKDIDSKRQKRLYNLIYQLLDINGQIIKLDAEFEGKSMDYFKKYLDQLNVKLRFKIRCKKRLFVGEGDFSYARALLQKHAVKHPTLPEAITATEYVSKKDLETIYSENFPENEKFLTEEGVTLLYGIDATKLSYNIKGLKKRYPRIHFNFPHDKSDFKKRSLPLLIAEFFASARKLQKRKDRIHVTLPKDPEKNDFYLGYVYGIYDGSSNAGYQLIRKRKFEKSRYPGYIHRITKTNVSATVTEVRREYIFENVKKDLDKIKKSTPPTKIVCYNEVVNSLSNLPTDSDSSEYTELSAEDSSDSLDEGDPER
ncbi:unnamed protein product [Didymodactylos carnosus]|uniref:25S rRNA (uridine-N(3))-methyltransferase BMT5-like domain-containing protein n=1 Tax=Didymodactylos carnosus TaxID=1234261 RepID=A0A814NG71_9BILA|nr:unnamed protein product [Didymodactylos carnosus]CAF1091543.1 unnamed protein product [Didymodactylos carnosus]CAF3562454.1 unnamed protein product [Didymodactylos carnosus]CAF3857013.1 unnamed protein product [Didymodactylos carnosus]